MVYYRTPGRKGKFSLVSLVSLDSLISSFSCPNTNRYSTFVPDTSTVGRHGEDLVTQYLMERGYIIHGRNVRLGRYEIDIVAEDTVERMMVFVEVKTRRAAHPLYPARTAVDAKKRRSLREAVARWVIEHAYDGAGRIDVVAVSAGRIEEHVVDIGSDFF